MKGVSVKKLEISKFTQLLVVFILLTSLLTPTVAAPRAAALHPQLIQLAEESPEQVVRLIVQKTDTTQNAEEYAERLGGQLIADLSIIHAFSVEMTAAGAEQLSKSGFVRWISLDGMVESAGKPPPKDGDTDLTENTFLDTMDVRAVWEMGIDGSGVGVAIIDSGVNKETDLKNNIVYQSSYNANATSVNDFYGHGTHVAGIIAMNGASSGGFYSGIAPGAQLISLKVNDETGMAYESDVVAAMQWVYENKEAYNIRVVNLSVNSTVVSSYHASPLDAAAEILWFNGVVVVAAAGNYWSDTDFNPVLAAPANDPFLITVGATDEKGTSRNKDDVVANYSAFGTTVDGIFKPDIYAPGTNIVSVLAKQSEWEIIAPERIEGEDYFRLSGTSMATPMVTGAVALLLQAEPNLTPDQVKFRLRESGIWVSNSKCLNVLNLVTSDSTESANIGVEASQLLWTGSEPIVWGSVAWNSVAWNSVAWNSVAWNSVAWNSVAWNSVAWNE
jgi:serine protease AprX